MVLLNLILLLAFLLFRLTTQPSPLAFSYFASPEGSARKVDVMTIARKSGE